MTFESHWRNFREQIPNFGDWFIFIQVASLMIILRLCSRRLRCLAVSDIFVSHNQCKSPGAPAPLQSRSHVPVSSLPSGSSAVLPYGSMALVTNWRSITIYPGHWDQSHQLSSHVISAPPLHWSPTSTRVSHVADVSWCDVFLCWQSDLLDWS